MEDISNLIYKKYRTLNIYNMAFAKYANIIRNASIIATFITFYIYLFIGSILIKLLILISIVIIAFYFNKCIKKLIIKRYSKYQVNKVTKIEDFPIILLCNFIKEKGLLNLDGINYLIKVYSKRTQNILFKNVAVGLIIITALINNVIAIILKGEAKDIERLFQVVVFIQQNLVTIISTIVFIIVFYLVAKYDVLVMVGYFTYLYGGKYKTLLKILETNILPMVIKSQDNSITKKYVYLSHKSRCYKR